MGVGWLVGEAEGRRHYVESSGSDLMVFFSALLDARCDVPFSKEKDKGGYHQQRGLQFGVTPNTETHKTPTVEHIKYGKQQEVNITNLLLVFLSPLCCCYCCCCYGCDDASVHLLAACPVGDLLPAYFD